MAYITADEVKAIRNELKARLPKFKFGVRKSSCGLSVNVTIKQGPIDFIGNYNDTVSSRPGGFRTGSPAKEYLSVNQYWYQDHFTGGAKKTLSEVLEVIKTAPARKWYDRSDAMVDYFDTAYYIDLNVGTWDKAYVLEK